MSPIEMQIIAAWCECTKCRSMSSEFYDLAGWCNNCYERFIVRNRKGDKAPLSVTCPHCEVNVYSWSESGEENEIQVGCKNEL